MNLIRYFTPLLLLAAHPTWAETPVPKHSLEVFAQNIYETFRTGDFAKFHRSTVFALGDEYFKRFLLEVNNDSIRDALTKGAWSKWQKDAQNVGTQAAEDELAAKWQTACLKEWRKNHRRLLEVGQVSVRHEAFEPILKGAEKEGIQWKTCRLTNVEILHEVSVGKGHFNLDGTESPVLYWEPGLTYRLRLDELTHGRSFRLSTQPEGPIIYERGVTYDKTGNGGLVVNFGEAPRSLYYFCPDKAGMGNRIIFSNGKKHPKRNILLTFTFGNPRQSYLILLRECLPIPTLSATSNSTAWNRWLLFERPVWLGPIRKDPTPE